MKTLNLAHRGFSSQFPENTMIAFEQAYQIGADGLELDVQLTRDGEVVIFHDKMIDRMTNGSGTLSELTLKDVQSVSIDGLMQDELPRQKIPTLKEYLSWVHDKDFLTNIELKTLTGEDIGLESKVLKLIFEYGVEERVIISSFHRQNMARVKKQSPSIQTGLLVPGCNDHILKLTKELGMDYIHPHALSLDETLIEQAHHFELGINTWTVNELADLEKVANEGIHAVITDFPDLLKQVQDKRIKVL